MPPKNKKANGKNEIKADKMFDIELLAPEIYKLLTARQLLVSPEDMVVFKSLVSIDKYVVNANEVMLNFMVENNFPQLLLDLIPRHKNISRFALKIVAALVKIPQVIDIITEENNVQMFIDSFLETDDEIIKEYDMFLLNLAATSEDLCALILREDFVIKLVDTITSTQNPDLKKNGLEVIYCITSCSSGFDFVNFLYPEMYICFLKSPYPEIRYIALLILESISKWNDDTLREKLRANKLLQMLFLHLMTDEWHYDHNIALSIIINSISNPDVSKTEIESLEFIKLLQFCNSDTVNESVILAVVSIIAEYVKDDFCRQVLFDFKAHDLLFKFFDYDCDMIKIKLCEAFSYIVMNICMAQKVADKSLVLPLTRMMNQENLPWDPYRQAPIKPLYNLSFTNNTVPILLYRCNTLKPLQNALMNREEICKAVFEMVVEIFEMLFLNRSIRDYILTEQVYPHLVKLMTDNVPKIAKITCNVIQDSITVCKYRDWFLKYGGLDVLMEVLQNQPNELADQITTLIEECSRNKILGLPLLKAGICQHLSKLPKYKIQPRRCQNIVENFYSYDLSMKFYDLDHLTIADVTGNCFYIYTQRKPRSFNLSEFPLILSPNDTILTVNFSAGPKNCIPVTDSSHRMKKSFEGDVEIMEILPPDPPATFSYDFYLHNASKNAYDFIKFAVSNEAKVRLLAEFVANQLSGHYSSKDELPIETDCVLHYSSIKKRISSNIIPLGMLRFGGFTERALLFKVLGDRLNVLSELIRNKFVAWVQVPMICKLNGSIHETFNPVEDGNCLLLKNYVVDLMFDVGRLMPVERWDAVAYTEGRPTVMKNFDPNCGSASIFSLNSSNEMRNSL